MNREETIIIVPGMGNSGPGHWQSIWQDRHSEFQRVEQNDWDEPVLIEWIVNLEDHLNSVDGDKIIVAHSLGCIISVEVTSGRDDIAAAMLVAPADLEAMDEPGYVPIKQLDFPSVVVASENDPWVTIDRAQTMASAWDSEFVNIGDAGHINAESGIGEWPEGWQIFENLLQRISGKP